MGDVSLSDVERIKSASKLLRGTLAESLADAATGAIAEDDTQLSKFHGIYQQDDRDLRAERRRQKLEPAFSFMIRARVPGGICSPQQWLNMDTMATRYASGSIRLTTRQAFQLHGVIKRNLKTTIAGINRSLLDTLAACGDVNRNVMASPVGVNTKVVSALADAAAAVSQHLTPQTGAYHEIWLDGEKLEPASAEVEPIYGATYLPRKFKMGFVIPPFNDTDVFTQDLGFIAIESGGELAGYNVAVGGGMGMAHGVTETFPLLGHELGFIKPEDVIAVSEAVVTTQRDFGDRGNRKHARLKYTIDDRGLDWFRGEVEERSGVTFESPRPYQFTQRGDLDGWLQDDRGQWHFGVFVENGRIDDQPGRQLLTGLRVIARVHRGDFRLTANQNLIISGIGDAEKARVQTLLDRYGITRNASPLRRNAMACVGFPTCGLAMAESERYLPDLIDRLDGLLAAHDLADEPIVLRMTGCPNGCARPYAAEIGLVGKSAGRYALFLGGDFCGHRLNRLVLDNADEAEIVATLDRLFGDYATRREPRERFGDFLVRGGHIAAVTHGSQIHHVSRPAATESDT